MAETTSALSLREETYEADIDLVAEWQMWNANRSDPEPYIGDTASMYALRGLIAEAVASARAEDVREGLERASGADLREALGEPFMTAHSGSDGFYVRLKYQTLAEMQAAHTALCGFFKGEPHSVSAEFMFPQPHRSRMWEVLRRLGEKAIRSQKITDHAAASAAQHEALQEIERLVVLSLRPASPITPGGRTDG